MAYLPLYLLATLTIVGVLSDNTTRPAELNVTGTTLAAVANMLPKQDTPDLEDPQVEVKQSKGDQERINETLLQEPVLRAVTLSNLDAQEDPQVSAKRSKNGQGLITEPDAVRKDLGGRCRTDNDCTSINNTYCKERVCVCNDGFIPSKHSLDKCVKVPSGLSDVCEEEAQCNHAVPASECRDGRCMCAPNYIFKHDRCWRKQKLGESCNITEQCDDVTSAICSQNVCDCQPPLIPSPYGKCLEIAGKEYHAACEEDIQCSLSYGDEARCSHGQCRCSNNYHYNGTTCIVDRKLGDSCSVDNECEVSEINNEEDLRICLDKTCTCAIGYSNFTGEDICTKSAGSNFAVVMWTWFLCFTVLMSYQQ